MSPSRRGVCLRLLLCTSAPLTARPSSYRELVEPEDDDEEEEDDDDDDDDDDGFIPKGAPVRPTQQSGGNVNAKPVKTR